MTGPKKQHDLFDWITLTTAIVGVVLVLSYTGITAYQAYVARDTEQHQLRAYLGVTGSILPPDHDGSAYVTIIVHNYGPTPAIHTDILTGTFVGSAALREVHLPFSKHQAEKNRNELVIFPTQEYPATIPKPLLSADIEQLKTGESAAFAFGSVLYEDIFGKRHETHFCFSWDKSDIISGTHGFCLYGNQVQ